MDIEYAKSLSYSKLRSIYKSYLKSLDLSKNSIATMSVDTFYLWNNGSQQLFWDVVTADDFDNIVRDSIKSILAQKATGSIDSRLSSYVSYLKKFRDYLFSDSLPLQEPEKDNATYLKEFLLDIDCLDPLAEWTSKFNLFDILKISRTEIRHSNMLSWLLNPNENHGLSDSILRGFIQYVVTNFSDDTDVFDTLLMDCHDFAIQREWHNIDIMAISHAAQFVLCIENKIDSGEHDNQLNRYRRIVEENYPQYKKMYIYLSPEGTEASDPDNWCSMGYQDVLNIVENAKRKVKLLADAELLIQNYIDTIRRDIVGDEELARICAEIYAKHQKALDLIYENRPDRASDLAAIFKSWATEMTAKGELEIVPEKCVKSYTRFKTKTMSALLPDAEKAISGWGTHNYYFYEISNVDGKDFSIQLVFSAKDIPEDLRDMCERINEFYPARQKKVNWQWRTPFSTRHSKVEDDFSEDKIIEQLNKKWEEIKQFETKLVSLLGPLEEV